MRTAWWLVVSCLAAASAQEQASTLAWSAVGQAAGAAGPFDDRTPASLAWMTGSQLAISAVPAIHGMSELRSGSAGFAKGSGSYGFGLSMTVLEAGRTRFTRAHLGGGIQLLDGVAAGLAGSIGWWTFPRYGSVPEGSAHAGIQVRSERITSGLLVGLRLQKGRPVTRTGLLIVIGGAVKFSDRVTAIAEAIDEDGVSLRAGASILLVDEVAIILSWSERSHVAGGGLAVRVDAWQVLSGSRWHPVLGWTHGVELSVAWE